jgi:hypothetical protein
MRESQQILELAGKVLPGDRLQHVNQEDDKELFELLKKKFRIF